MIDLTNKQFCKNNHDIFICGTYTNGQCKDCRKDYYIEHRDEKLQYQKEYSKEHKEEIIQYMKEWHEKHKVEEAETMKKWFKEHKEKANQYHKKYQKNQLKTNINFKLAYRLRKRFNQALKNNQKVGSAVKDLGCTIEFLKQYIQSKFYANMSWDNYGKVWHLDHIIPLCKFDLTNRDQFLTACHYTNLQPLTIEDHKIKTAIDLHRNI